MKNLFESIKSFKWNFVRIWLFFFLFYMLWDVKFKILKFALASGVWAVAISLTSIFIISVTKGNGSEGAD